MKLTKITQLPIAVECARDEHGARGGYLASPPWYAVSYTGGPWEERVWFDWLHYQGPPRIFLTRERAEQHAMKLRDQWSRTWKEWGRGNAGRITINVVKVGPT